DPRPLGKAHSSFAAVGRIRLSSNAGNGTSGGDLPRPVDPTHGASSSGPRHRWKRLVFPGSRRDLLLAAIEPPCPWKEGLGTGAREGPRLYLRAAFLVVQHAFERRLVRHPPPGLPGGWPEDLEHVHPAARAQGAPGPRAGHLPPL